jgi:hypothetical protein
MNAIDLLEKQHREAEDLFEKLEKAELSEKETAFAQLADMLTIHADIEERVFYPACITEETEAKLREAVEEHLALKRFISDLLELDADDPSFDAKVKVLKEQNEHHVHEEEDELFPKVRTILDGARLEEIGASMQAMMEQMVGTDPRFMVPMETLQAAPIEGPGKKAA